VRKGEPVGSILYRKRDASGLGRQLVASKSICRSRGRYSRDWLQKLISPRGSSQYYVTTGLGLLKFLPAPQIWSHSFSLQCNVHRVHWSGSLHSPSQASIWANLVSIDGMTQLRVGLLFSHLFTHNSLPQASFATEVANPSPDFYISWIFPCCSENARFRFQISLFPIWITTQWLYLCPFMYNEHSPSCFT
jgi:hypothetical protein